jgi:putative two-component system response regulator
MSIGELTIPVRTPARIPRLDNAPSPVAQPARQDASILIVDDEPINIQVVRKYLSLAGYSNFIITTDANEVVSLANAESPDVILLDIMMPGTSGLDVLLQLRSQEQTAWLPIVIMTALDDREVKAQALDKGATDFLTKPIDPSELVSRVRNAVVFKAHHDHLQHYSQRLEEEIRIRTAELEESRLQVIRCLARAAEFRDNQTGRHTIRVGRYSGIIARHLDWQEPEIAVLEQAALLHDVGKIGIPDAILLKPGKLDPDEFEYVQKHCGFGKRVLERLSLDEFSVYAAHTEFGAGIVDRCNAPILDLAARIALTHHEKWDGSGYPVGLAGNDIPIEGRIVAAADVFDALSTKRPYKSAFPVARCFEIMEESRGTHFDPQVLDAFVAGRHEIVAVQIELADVE